MIKQSRKKSNRPVVILVILIFILILTIGYVVFIKNNKLIPLYHQGMIIGISAFVINGVFMKSLNKKKELRRGGFLKIH